MEDIFTQITGYLWTQSWQIAALVVLLAIATFALKNKSAHVRYLLWLILLAKCLVPAFITIPLAVLPAKEAPPAPLYQPSPPPAKMFAPVDTEPMYEPAASLVYEMSEAKEPSIFTKLADVTLSQWIAVVWVAGIVFFLLMASAKAVRANRWLKKHRIPLPPELAADIARLFESLGLRSPPNVWLIGRMSQPFVFGLIRGQIYLPANFTQINTQKARKGVLGHELSHVIRFDAAINLLQILAQALLWFHPFVWWANKRIRAEREKCCDEMALATLDAKAKEYSSAIVNTLLAEHKSRIPVPSLAIAGPVKNLEDRIKTIMAPNKKFYKRPGLIAIISALLIAAIAVPTTLALTHRQPDEIPDTKTESGSEVLEPNSVTIEVEPSEETSPLQFLSTVRILEVKKDSAVSDHSAAQTPANSPRTLEPNELSAFLQLVETDPDAHVLAAPKILILDNKEGNFKAERVYVSGYKEPESGSGEPVPIEGTAGLHVSVTPHQAEGKGVIRVEFKMERVEILEFKQAFYKDKYPSQIPIKRATEIVSTVGMTSGQTVVFGDANSDSADGLLMLLTCERMQHDSESEKKLTELGKVVLQYAAEHDDKFPFSLVGRTIGDLDVAWYRNNITYLGAGLTTAVPPGTLIAYDKAPFEKGECSKVLFADGNVQLISGADLRKLLADPPVQQWRQAFEKVYRLEDNDMLKRIAPPYIPERVDYYEIEHKDQASAIRHKLPDYFQFRWDGKLINWGMGFMSGENPLSHIIGRILKVGRHNFEGPAELLDIQLPGDWILRKDTRREDLLKALQPIVAAETGRDIRFVSRLVTREVIIATGRFSPSQERINIFVDQIDSEQGAGGGAGTVPEFLEWVANRIDMPILDNTEPYGSKMSWDNHRDSSLAGLKYSPEIYDPKLDALLKNLTDQTSLHFERTTRNIPKWFVVEGDKEPAPEYNPNIGGYSSYSPDTESSDMGPATVKGRVTDPNSEPIAGVTIQIREHNPGATSIHAPDVQTDAQGNYSYGVNTEYPSRSIDWPYTVGALWHQQLPQGGQRHQYIGYNRIFEGSHTVDFAFDRFPAGTAAVTGKVRLQNGQSLDGFMADFRLHVDWKDRSGDHIYQYGYQLPVDANYNSFRIMNLPAGTYDLTIYNNKHRGLTTYQQEIDLRQGENKTINCMLAPRLPLFYGRVLFEDGTPAILESEPWPGGRIHVLKWNEFGGTGVGPIDKDGYFTAYLSDEDWQCLDDGRIILYVYYPDAEKEGTSQRAAIFPPELLSNDKTKAQSIKIKLPDGYKNKPDSPSAPKAADPQKEAAPERNPNIGGYNSYTPGTESSDTGVTNPDGKPVTGATVTASKPEQIAFSMVNAMDYFQQAHYEAALACVLKALQIEPRNEDLLAFRDSLGDIISSPPLQSLSTSKFLGRVASRRHHKANFTRQPLPALTNTVGTSAKMPYQPGRDYTVEWTAIQKYITDHIKFLDALDDPNTPSPSRLVTQLYDVSILLQPWGTSQLPPGAAAALSNTGGTGEYRTPALESAGQQDSTRSLAQQLIDEIQTIIDPNTWFENGGEGTISMFQGRKLIVRQTPDVHRKIDEFLRNARGAIRLVSFEARFILAPESILESAGLHRDDANSIDFEAIPLDPNTLAPAVASALAQSFNVTSSNMRADGSIRMTQQNEVTTVSAKDKVTLHNQTTTCSGMIISSRQADSVLRAAQISKDARTLIAPRATILDGEFAVFEMSANPYIAGSDANEDMGGYHTGTEMSMRHGFSLTGPSNQFRPRLKVQPTIVDDEGTVDTQLDISIIGLPPIHPIEEQSSAAGADRDIEVDRVAGLHITGSSEVPAGKTLIITAPLEAVGQKYTEPQLLLILIKPTVVTPEEVEPPRIAN